MTSDPLPASGDRPDFPDEDGPAYSLEVIAGLAGTDTTTVLRYQEQGFLQPVLQEGGSPMQFDTECLRQLRRMEHLRMECGVNEAGLRLFLDLIREVEQLRSELRRMQR